MLASARPVKEDLSEKLSHYLVLTCEHASNRVPARYAHIFRGDPRLEQHWGFDIGAAVAARAVAAGLGAPIVMGKYTRLLVDLNRSIGNKTMFCKEVRALSEGERERILADHYRPHRQAVKQLVDEALHRVPHRPVLHVAIHSFTPFLRGIERRADVGILYDPARPHETAVAKALRAQMQSQLGGLHVFLNSPYRGNTDGLSRALRAEHTDLKLCSISIELNQKYAAKPVWNELSRAVVGGLGALLRDLRLRRAGG